MRSLRLSLTYANVVSTMCLFLVLGGGAYAATKLPKNSVGSTQIKNDAVSSSKVRDRSLLRTDFKAGELPSGERGAAGPSGERGAAGPPGSDAQFNGAAAGGALTGAYPAPALSCPAGTSFQSGFCFETSVRAGADWAGAATTCATAGRRLATPSELWAVARRSDVSMTAAEWTSTAYNYVDSPVGYEMATTVFEIVAGPGTGIHIGHDLNDAMVAYRCVVNAGSP